MSFELNYELLVALLVLISAAWSVAARDSYSATVGFVSYGLLLAIVWMQLQAVDVALTEVAIGSGLTGLLLLALRETRAMGLLLVAHLGVVLALFVTMPYGKFVHALYRLAALIRFHLERRRPLPDIAPE
jgi:uncharacterized MnhB-related membrane protein